jgi:putative DNA primase/helicase
MMDLRSIAIALDGVVSGRQVLAPGPGHSPQDRSLAIRPSREAPDGMLIHSHAGDDWRQCREYVRSRLGLPAWQPGDDRAQKIWNEAINPRGTTAESYLRARALELPERFAGDVLRFHPRTPWRNENTGQTDRIPCLIAAFRSLDDDEITAIHRIRVDQPGRWPKTERLMLGVVHRAAVKLGNPETCITIGEGVETCMAAMQLGVGTAWALGSAGNISFFPTIDGISELTILGETGEASARAVKICGRRWRRASRRVFVSRSAVGSDHNDILMQQRVS